MDVGLDIYTVSVRVQRSKTKLVLDDFDGAGSSVLEVMKKALAPLVKGNYKGVPEKTLSIKDLKSTATGFDGLVTIGTYGLASDVVDVNDGSTAFSKDKHHADTQPFYFRLYCPAGGNTALLAAQRLGHSGAGSPLRSVFADHFIASHPQYRLLVGAIAPDYVVDKFIKTGTPKSVRFIKNSIPADFADVVSGKSKESIGSVEIIVKSKNPIFFRKSQVRTALSSVDGIKSVYSFDAFEPDDVKMQVSVNGKIRTVSLANKGKMRTTFDITDSVTLSPSGYPSRASVATQAHDLMKEVGKPLGIKL